MAKRERFLKDPTGWAKSTFGSVILLQIALEGYIVVVQ